MAITYTWEVEQLERAPSVTIGETTYEDVVSVVHWRLWGADGQNTTSVFGLTALDTSAIDSGSFVLFDDLDAQTTAHWAVLVMSAGKAGAVASLKGQIASRLSEMASPPVLKGFPDGFTTTVADAALS